MMLSLERMFCKNKPFICLHQNNYLKKTHNFILDTKDLNQGRMFMCWNRYLNNNYLFTYNIFYSFNKDDQKVIYRSILTQNPLGFLIYLGEIYPLELDQSHKPRRELV